MANITVNLTGFDPDPAEVDPDEQVNFSLGTGVTEASVGWAAGLFVSTTPQPITVPGSATVASNASGDFGIDSDPRTPIRGMVKVGSA